VIKLSFFESEELNRLQREIDESLIDLFPKPQKFTSHLTLGRIKIIKKEKEFYNKLKEFNFIKDEFEINKFQLVQSISQKGRQIYKILYEFKP
jgi:2'-5' RNA ligase